MIKPKVIKTDTEYQEALAYLDGLMDASPGTPEEEELELISVLVERYEQEHFSIDLPDPIEAIKFRMEQQGLTRKDLEPYLGSQSKVSEVLNRKRPLSLAMIRALHEGLGIPAEVLLQEAGKQLTPGFDPSAFPFAEMYRRGYFSPFHGSLREAEAAGEELLSKLLAPFATRPAQRIYCRQSGQTRLQITRSPAAVAEAKGEYGAESDRPLPVDENALIAWHARALALAEAQVVSPYHHEKITADFISEVVKLSYYSTGPLLAREMLAKHGIPLVILPQLPRAALDGACFRAPSGRAVIGLTLRNDRVDNFWFTLAHELAHIHLHLDDPRLAFFDDTETGADLTGDAREDQANALTGEVLIPQEDWEREREMLLMTKDAAAVQEFADRLRISPAIVAGRIRWQTGKAARFNALVGREPVGKFFIYNDPHAPHPT